MSFIPPFEVYTRLGGGGGVEGLGCDATALICDLEKGGIYGCGTAWPWYSQEGQERIFRHSKL